MHGAMQSHGLLQVAERRDQFRRLSEKDRAKYGEDCHGHPPRGRLRRHIGDREKEVRHLACPFGPGRPLPSAMGSDVSTQADKKEVNDRGFRKCTLSCPRTKGSHHDESDQNPTGVDIGSWGCWALKGA